MNETLVVVTKLLRNASDRFFCVRAMTKAREDVLRASILIMVVTDRYFASCN